MAIRFVAGGCDFGAKSHVSGFRRRDVFLDSISEGGRDCSRVKRLMRRIQHSFGFEANLRAARLEVRPVEAKNLIRHDRSLARLDLCRHHRMIGLPRT